MKLKVNYLILIFHIKFVCVFHCEAVLLMKCARSYGHADLSHDRISCTVLVVAVDSCTSLEELFPLSTLILRNVLTGTMFNDRRDMKF